MVDVPVLLVALVGSLALLLFTERRYPRALPLVIAGLIIIAVVSLYLGYGCVLSC